MNEKELLDLKPGMELNVEVAREVMGHKVVKDETFGYMERFVSLKDGSSVYEPVQRYSEDIEQAQKVIEKMTDEGYADAASWADFGEGKYTEAEAVCKAALSALLKKQYLD